MRTCRRMAVHIPKQLVPHIVHHIIHDIVVVPNVQCIPHRRPYKIRIDTIVLVPTGHQGLQRFVVGIIHQDTIQPDIGRSCRAVGHKGEQGHRNHPVKPFRSARRPHPQDFLVTLGQDTYHRQFLGVVQIRFQLHLGPRHALPNRLGVLTGRGVHGQRSWRSTRIPSQPREPKQGPKQRIGNGLGILAVVQVEHVRRMEFTHFDIGETEGLQCVNGRFRLTTVGAERGRGGRTCNRVVKGFGWLGFDVGGGFRVLGTVEHMVQLFGGIDVDIAGVCALAEGIEGIWVGGGGGG